MNKWIRRTAGTVGIAGGALLLGTAAHADNPVIPDPQSLHGVTDTANLDDGVSGFGVSVDTPGQRDTVGLLPDGGGPIRSGTNNGELGAVVHAPTQDGQPRDVFANGRTPDIFQALPITDVVPMDGLGMPVQNARTLPAPAQERFSPEAGGLPLHNIPIGTSMAGDSLRGGNDLARDGFAGNGLGIPLGDRLPLGAAQNLTQSQPLGAAQNLTQSQPLDAAQNLAGGGAGNLAGGGQQGGSPLGAAQNLAGGAGGGLPLLSQSGQPGGRSQTTPTAQTSRSQPMFSGDAVQVLPAEAGGAGWGSSNESFGGFTGGGFDRSFDRGFDRGYDRAATGRHRATEAGGLPINGIGGVGGGGIGGVGNGGGLPTAGGLPVVGGMLQGGTLPTKANVNTLPGAPAVPVHDLIAPGTAATGASAGNTLNQATGTVNNAMSKAGGATGGGTESLPLSDEGIPVVGGLTGPNGTQGVDLPDTRSIPVVGNVADGLTGGKHRAQYSARHSA